MIGFEYKILKDWDTSVSFENSVNALAKEGWRLTVFECSPRSSYLYVVMERAIPEPQPKNNTQIIRKAISQTGMESKG